MAGLSVGAWSTQAAVPAPGAEQQLQQGVLPLRVFLSKCFSLNLPSATCARGASLCSGLCSSSSAPVVETASPIDVPRSPEVTIFPGRFSALGLRRRKGKEMAVTVTNTCKVSSNYCLAKSNICCEQRTNCGGRERKSRLLECKWNRCPDALGKRSFPLQIRALNYKAFTNENSCGKSSALICVMASVTGD